MSCPIGCIDREGIMQMAITFMAVVAGMVFSLAVALLAEELIFGQVFRLFFPRPMDAAKPAETTEAQKA
jgi:hypothetical protein